MKNVLSLGLLSNYIIIDPIASSSLIIIIKWAYLHQKYNIIRTAWISGISLLDNEHRWCCTYLIAQAAEVASWVAGSSFLLVALVLRKS